MTLRYFKFPIGQWRDKDKIGPSPSPAKVLAFFEPMLRFVESELEAGHSVLIHCLAGAHRAGCAGIASLMWLCNFDHTTAIPAAQRLRPVIDPIGGYPIILEKLNAALEPRRKIAAEPTPSPNP